MTTLSTVCPEDAPVLPVAELTILSSTQLRKEGICDACGGELILRDDDKPETVKQRLTVYHDRTQPLIDYYTKRRNSSKKSMEH